MPKIVKVLLAGGILLLNLSSCEELDDLGILGKKCAVEGCKSYAQKDDIYCAPHRKIYDETLRKNILLKQYDHQNKLRE